MSYSRLSRRPEEAKLVFAALGNMRGSIGALKFAERSMYREDVANEAIAALLRIAPTLDEKYKADIYLALTQAMKITDSRQNTFRIQRSLGRYAIQEESPSGQDIGETGEAQKKIIFICDS